MKRKILPWITIGFLLWLYDQKLVVKSHKSGSMRLLIDEKREDTEGQLRSWKVIFKEEDALP